MSKDDKERKNRFNIPVSVFVIPFLLFFILYFLFPSSSEDFFGISRKNYRKKVIESSLRHEKNNDENAVVNVMVTTNDMQPEKEAEIISETENAQGDGNSEIKNRVARTIKEQIENNISKRDLEIAEQFLTDYE